MAQAFGTKLLILLFLAVFQHALGEGLAGDRIDSNVCIVTTTTEDACKTSPSGRYALCMQRGEREKSTPLVSEIESLTTQGA